MIEALGAATIITAALILVNENWKLKQIIKAKDKDYEILRRSITKIKRDLKTK